MYYSSNLRKQFKNNQWDCKLIFMRQVKYISYFNIYENVVFYLLKVGLSPSKNICVICLIESPLKMMKNSFHLILRALLVLKIFMFLLLIFGHVGKTA